MSNLKLVKFVFLLISLAYSINMYGKDDTYNVHGIVVNNFTNERLDSVLVTLMTNDSTIIDTCMTSKGTQISEYLSAGKGSYSFTVPKLGKYIIKAERFGYEDSYMECELTRKREWSVSVKPIKMNKIHQLKEVTITATKIKMVMRGDTIVYNADAFNLAEGSMLDALISKLPGAKLTKNGEIFVNGKKIQSLLVNGNNFFSADPREILENLPAYTVSKIKVFDQEGPASRMMKRDMGDKQYVMDVRLKKEYATGYLGNLEGGLGSENRYTLKAVGQRFSDMEIIRIYSDINNINLNQRAALGGEDTPQSNPDGRIAKKEIGLQAYRFFKGVPFNYIGTHTNYIHTGSDMEVKTTGQTFLPTGDSYNRSRSFSTSSSDHLTSQNTFAIQDNLLNNRMSTITEFIFSYHHNRGLGNSQSETSDTSSVLNNLLSSNSIESKNLDLYFNNYEGFRIIADYIRINAGFTYNRNTQNTFTMDDVQYPSGTLPRDYRNNFRDQTHQHFTANADASYDYGLREDGIRLEYKYKYTFNKSNNMLYRLDKLSDRDSSRFDLLPSAVDALAQVKDGSNSFLYREYRNEHTINLLWHEFSYHKNKGWDNSINFPVHFVNANLNYERMSKHHVGNHKAFLEPSLDIRRWEEHWSWTYRASISSSLPDLTNMVDYRDDSDPLNIRLGNSDLRDIHYYNTNFYLAYKGSRQRMANINIGYSQTDNEVAYGLKFDKSTGVSTLKPQSVNGNWKANFSTGYTQEIDKAHKWTIDNQFSADYNHNVDLATVEGYTDSQRSIVHNYQLDDNIKLNFRPDDKNEICLHAGGTYNIIKGERSGFEDIKAGDYRVGMNAQIALPWKFNITSDITMFARRGYQSYEMNTTDWVWNAQITRSFLNGRLISKLSGFDILHQLSNTQYAVNAQGRTERWHNSIPRYVMLSVAWSFNVNPKK